jgi:hypothetical protein
MSTENLKKRGRKKIQEPASSNNIVMIIEETEPLNQETLVNDSILKKRGRKSKGGKLISKQPTEVTENRMMANIILHLKCSTNDLIEHNDKINKIVTNPLTYDPTVPPSIMSYNTTENTSFSLYDDSTLLTRRRTDSSSQIPNENSNNVSFEYFNSVTAVDTTVSNDIAYEEMKPVNAIKTVELNKPNLCSLCNEKIDLEEPMEEDNLINIKDINLKLKRIKLQLYNNTNPEKKSACFWCTYPYDNQACYIPKYEMDGQLYGYGSFCRPECAAAYLMKENIDDSMKFERYHLLNQIYSRVYEYKKNIKPAPNPYYLLDKFYGNLSIQEYRKLLKSEHMLLVIEKPMTRILPELHEDNDDFMTNIYNNSGGNGMKTTTNSQYSGVYKVKRQSEKQKSVSKNTILKESFLGR